MKLTYLCLVCGKEYEPVRLNQKYCSKKCANRENKNNRRFGGARDYVIERDGAKCVNCGSRSQLSVHHKDEDRANNNPSNLVTLCLSCHKKEHPETVDKGEIRCCAICGHKFHPLTTKRKVQVLCGDKKCKAKWKALQKRSEHKEVVCIICGDLFIQKHSRHLCCGDICIKQNNDLKKAERYINKKEELKTKQIKYYADHREERKAYIKKWQDRNKDKVIMYKRKWQTKHRQSA